MKQTPVAVMPCPNLPAEELLPTRHSLIARLKNWDDQESWRDFFNTYWKLIYGVAVRAGLNDAAAQDVVQDTIVTVARKISTFRNDPELGSFKGWLFTITRRRIVDYLRRQPKHCAFAEQDDASTAVYPEGRDLVSFEWERTWELEFEKNLVDAALENVKQRVKARQFQLFDCLVLKEWPVEQVTRMLRVNIGQVYFAKYKIGRMLRREILRLQRDWV
jgi:RNA polymerase sigma factor (sigma-70 family)